MRGLYEKIQEAVSAIRRRWPERPKVGIVLGTGLGGFGREIQSSVVIPYREIPHFPETTVVTHAGQLVCGELEGLTVVAMEGRFHYYEGYSMQEITFPVRVLKALGGEVLVLSSACGGMNPHFGKGDLVVLEDHINLMPDNPLRGWNDDRLGPRFPDMSCPYDRRLLRWAEEVAMEHRIRLHRAVYVAVPGPNLETRAEYRFLRGIGADVVGMSTVPEAIVAVHGGLSVLALSVVTDLCFPDALKPADVDDIIRTANEAEPKLRLIVRGVLRRLAQA
jgi:purine-nucleoside phosphorylase